MSYNCGMRALPAVAALWLSLVAAGQELPPYQLPVDVASRVRDLTLAEPLRLLAGLASADLDLRGRADAFWQQLPARSRCALMRAGLRSADVEVAAGAARVATDNYEWLDTVEIKRAAQRGMARCNRIDTPFDVGEFFDLLDAEDAAHFLGNPGPRPREVPQFVGPLHQRLGPEHWPQLEQLAHGDDLLLRDDAVPYLALTKYRRLAYAHFLLSQPLDAPVLPDDFDPMVDRLPYQPRRFSLRAKGDGYHPVLAALLEDQFLVRDKDRAGAGACAWRWARAERAGEIDRALLLRLAACDRDAGQRVAIAGLARLEGEDVHAALRQIAAGEIDADVAPLLALGELVRRDDAAARARLRILAFGHPLALATLWQVDRAAFAPYLDAACTGAGRDGDAAMRRLLEAVDDGRFWGLPMTGLDAALLARVRAVECDDARLGRVLAALPRTRRPELARRVIGAIDAGNVDGMPLGVLELLAPEALALRLHALLADDELDDDALVTTIAAVARLPDELLGSDAFVARLYDRCAQIRSEDSRERLRLRIAAVRGRAVWTVVAQRLEDAVVPNSYASAGALAAAVAATGIDHRTAHSLYYNLQANADAQQLHGAFRVMKAPLLRGDGEAAIAALLAQDVLGLGLVTVWPLADAVALPALERGRTARERGEYLAATGQLARRGHAAARAEVESAISRRLYGWIDRLGTDVLTDGKSLDRVPLLLSQVDSNCCTFAVIASALEDVFEVDPFVGESGVQLRPAVLHAVWREHRDDLRWSRIADRWLIVPE